MHICPLDPTDTFLRSLQSLPTHLSAYTYAFDLNNLLHNSHHIFQIYSDSDQLEISIGTMDLCTSPWNQLLALDLITKSRIIRCINKNTGSNMVKKNVRPSQIESNTIYTGTPPPLSFSRAYYQSRLYHMLPTEGDGDT